MARATLEMFLKLTGANKTSQGLEKVSKSTKELDKDVDNASKANAQFAAGMSSLSKTAIAGAAAFAAKQLADFAISSIQAASAAQEAAGAFGTTFGGAAEKLSLELEKNANMFGLTTSEAKQLVGVFGAVAQGLGFTQNESADLSARLFSLAGDIASFNNITAGATPVLQAFRSAIVGEREALKTYGISVQEAEVQTKAFSMTGKRSADELTKQEKALATTELIFERAAVQIGNAEREAGGFAAQMLLTRSATQELREEVGAELLPAAGELLGVFNNFVDNISPAVVSGFSLINDAIVATVDATQRGNTELNKYFRTFILGQNALKGDADALETLNKEMQKETEILNENSVQIVTNTGLSLDFLDVINKMNAAYAQEFTNLQKTRLGLLTNETQTKKLSDTIRTKLNPIFGEQNSLIMSNINLELERSKIMDLITSANDDVARATRNRNQAAKDLERLQIDENVRDAEAAIRKNELSTQIALLTQAKQNGKDVTAELALAEAELAEAEFELANDSDALRLARERLDLAEQNLQKSIDNQNKAQEIRKNLLYEIIDVTEDSEKATDKYTSALERNLEAYKKFRAFETAPDLGFPRPDPDPEPDIPPIPEPTPVPTPLVSDNSNVDTGLKNAATDVTVKVELSDNAEDFLQVTQERLAKKGYAIR